MPFDEEDPSAEIVTKKHIGMKLSNKDSMLSSIPKKPSKDDFEKKAVEVNETLNSYVSRAAELTPQFGKVLRDKTLSTNKSPMAIDAEKELLNKLVQLSIDMNTDRFEMEAAGASALINMLLHSLLIQRDKINSLDYSVSLLEKQLATLPLTTKEK